MKHIPALLWLGSWLVLTACGSHSQSRSNEPLAQQSAIVATVAPQPQAAPSLVATPSNEFPEDRSLFEITKEDPSIGRPDALVTVVVFGDLQCPFTARSFTTLQDLLARNGDTDLRVVWKHFPMPFHAEARSAAEASIAVHRLGGSEAFFCFISKVFDNQKAMGAHIYRSAATSCGLSASAMEAEVQGGYPASKLSKDERVVEVAGVKGTPHSFFNGSVLTGAQPLDRFVEAFEAERLSVMQMLSEDTVPGDIHTRRVAVNFSKPEKPVPSASRFPSPQPPDTAVYHVPIGRSPTLGASDALVTLVMFQDFQCPFCKRVVPTIEELRREYGKDLRVVFKHNPLPFHPHAMAAAKLSMKARAQKGETGFWQTHDALFHETRIDDASLEEIARRMGLNLPAARSAISSNRHQSSIDADMQLAVQLNARAAPTFFINGRRLTGAQPIEKFRALIDEVKAEAQAMNARGIPRNRIYAETIKNGVQGSPDP